MWIFQPEIRSHKPQIQIWAYLDKLEQSCLINYDDFPFKDHAECQNHGFYSACKVRLLRETGHNALTASSELISKLSICTPRKKNELVIQVSSKQDEIGRIFTVTGLPKNSPDSVRRVQVHIVSADCKHKLLASQFTCIVGPC